MWGNKRSRCVCVLIITEAVINYISGGGVMDVPLADRVLYSCSDKCFLFFLKSTDDTPTLHVIFFVGSDLTFDEHKLVCTTTCQTQLPGKGKNLIWINLGRMSSWNYVVSGNLSWSLYPFTFKILAGMLPVMYHYWNWSPLQTIFRTVKYGTLKRYLLGILKVIF